MVKIKYGKGREVNVLDNLFSLSMKSVRQIVYKKEKKVYDLFAKSAIFVSLVSCFALVPCRYYSGSAFEAQSGTTICREIPIFVYTFVFSPISMKLNNMPKFALCLTDKL